jgi:hypothetical protein
VELLPTFSAGNVTSETLHHTRVHGYDNGGFGNDSWIQIGMWTLVLLRNGKCKWQSEHHSSISIDPNRRKCMLAEMAE